MVDESYAGTGWSKDEIAMAMGPMVQKYYPDDNPKTAIGVTKAPYHLVPPAAIHHTALAFADGAAKYGPYNWREKTVSASVYYGAMLRHLTAYWDGEDLSQDARVHHLGHVMACCAILLDAGSINKLNDDRPLAGAASKLQEEYASNKKEVIIERQVPPPASPVCTPNCCY